MELGDAKKRCGDVIERIERLPGSTKITASCKRTLLKLARSELSFLSRVSSSSTSSTPLSVNIGHLEAVVHILHHPSITGVSRVCKPIPLSPKTCFKHVHVDIVCTLNRNPVWILVSHRNPKYITWRNDESQTNQTKGLQFRIQQLTAAARSALALKPSSLILFFSHGLSTILSDQLKHEFGATELQLGFPDFHFHFDLMEEAGDWINVLVAPTSYQEASVFEIEVGDAVLSSDVKDSCPMAAKWEMLEEDHTPFFPAFSSLISKINLCSLDVKDTETANPLGDCHLVNFGTTALIALVSGISNGGTEKLLATPESELRQRFKGNYEFVIGQVMSEIQNPILVELSCSISGKRGIICESVHSEFKELVSMFGGPNEKLRASHLLKYLTVVPDSPSKRMMSLPTTRKLALKNKVVFGTGDYWRAPTVTANMAFVRAVSQAGMSLFTIEHRPRALTGD